MPLVTIGIPTYRRPKLLARAVASALAQDHPDLEVVVSDNASGDDTPDVVRGFADPRIRLLAQATNIGPAANFWAVLEAARGDYFMWLGDDDWIDPTYVRRCLALMADDAAVVGGMAANYRAGVLEGHSKPMDLLDESPRRRVIDYYRTVEENPIFYGLMRTRMLAACKLTNTLGADWLVMAQIVFQGKALTARDTHVHRERDNSTSQSIASMVRTLRLPPIQKLAPATSIATAAVRDIYDNTTVFASLPATERAALASSVAAIVLARMGIWRRLRNAIGRERASRWKAAVLGR